MLHVVTAWGKPLPPQRVDDPKQEAKFEMQEEKLRDIYIYIEFEKSIGALVRVSSYSLFRDIG